MALGIWRKWRKSGIEPFGRYGQPEYRPERSMERSRVEHRQAWLGLCCKSCYSFDFAILNALNP
jgi:hypothetical protein